MAPREIYGGAGPRYGAFRVIEQRGDWVTLETLGEPRGPHCAESLRALEPFRLRFFVPARALALVTRREVAQPFSDGTRIELARGVPAEPVDRDLFRVHLGAVTTVVRLSRADVGTRYLPSAELPPAQPTGGLDGAALAAAVPILGQTGRVEAREPVAAPVYAERPRGAETLVELRPPCARVVVRVPSHAIVPWQPQANEEPAAPGTVVVRAGAIVRWRGGAHAGVATRDVVPGVEVEGDGVRRCFRRMLHQGIDDGDPNSYVDLCFAREDVREAGAAPSSRLGDPR